MGSFLEAQFERELAGWRGEGLARSLPEAPDGPQADFISNDYLSLALHPDVIAAGSEALHEHGAGTGAARLLGGSCAEHSALEREAAEWLVAESALLFPSGYQANLGVLGALTAPGDVILSDALNHASIIDGCRLSRARVAVYPHQDLDGLERRLLAAAGARRRIVVVEGVYGMDGDRARIPELLALCARHDAALVVDESHAIGVLGTEGRGACAAAGADLESPHLVARVITGGKALGASGALVVGSRALQQVCLHRARSFLFTTAPPPATAAALRAAIRLARRADGARTAIQAKAEHFARCLDLPEPASAILPLPVGNPTEAVALGEALEAEGIRVGVVRPPTVPAGTSRLRVVMHAHNTTEEIDRLVARIRSQPPPAATALHAPAVAKTTFVVGTDTGIGKTVVSAILVAMARELGAARYWKPVQTGDDSDTATVTDLARCAAEEICTPCHELPLPASPHEAAHDAGITLDPAAIDARLGELQREHATARLVVELAGGLLVPYTDDGHSQADWLARRRPDLVLVARSGLGTLNHTMLTLEALRARRLEPRALFLVGEPHASNRATLATLSGVPHVIEIPTLAPLDADSVARTAAGIDEEEVLR